jgi:peptidoglycan hydrolase-like protein with peptidoglycan-binding domain
LHSGDTPSAEDGRAAAAVIAFASDDAQEAEAICMVLTKAGWPVLRRRFTGSAEDAVLAADVATVRCLIVLWSASASPLQRLHFAVERAHRQDALITLRLDDGVFPIDAAERLDFVGWPQRASIAACRLLLDAVGARLGPPSAQPAQPGAAPLGANLGAKALQLYSPRPRPSRPIALAVAGGLIAVSLAAAAALTLAGDLRFTDASRAANRSSAEAGQEAMDAAATTDAAARLRGYLQSSGDETRARASLTGPSAREDKDWLQVRAANDAEHALALLTRFQATYPDGRYAGAAAALENDWRAVIGEAQAHLQRLGYPTAHSDGLLHPQTRAAVRAFQSGAGLAPDGQIDRALIFALQGQKPPPNNPAHTDHGRSAIDIAPTSSPPSLPRVGR